MPKIPIADSCPQQAGHGANEESGQIRRDLFDHVIGQMRDMPRQDTCNVRCAACGQLKAGPHLRNFDGQFFFTDFSLNQTITGVIFHRKIEMLAVDVHVAIDHFDVMDSVTDLHLPARRRLKRVAQLAVHMARAVGLCRRNEPGDSRE